MSENNQQWSLVLEDHTQWLSTLYEMQLRDEAMRYGFDSIGSSIPKAAKSKITDIIEDLVKTHGNIDIRSNSDCSSFEMITGGTPLMYLCSVMWENRDLIEIVLAAGADIQAHSDKGETPLSCVAHNMSRTKNCREDAEPLIDFMVDNGADVQACYDDGENAALWSTVNGGDSCVVSFSAMRALLKHSADPNSGTRSLLAHVCRIVCWQQTEQEETPEFQAVRLLIDKKAGINPEFFEYFEDTPLGAAAQGCNVQLVRLLLAKGANSTISIGGKTLLDVARNLEIKELIAADRMAKSPDYSFQCHSV